MSQSPPLTRASERMRPIPDLRSAPAPDPEFDPCPSPSPSTTPLPRLAVAIGLGLILAIYAARGLAVARVDSITSDESTYLLHGLHFWATGDDLELWELGTPRLPHLIHAAGSYLALRQAGLLGPERRPSSGGDRRDEVNALVLSGMPRVLLPARVLAIGWGLGLLSICFWAVARTRGPALGLVAAALLAMVPEVIAHGSIAGSDMPFAAAATLAAVLMARYAERPGLGRWIGLALAIGLAWSTRHTALILLPAAGMVHLGSAWKAGRPRGLAAMIEWLAGSAASTTGLVLIAGLVLWAGDGFGTIRLDDASGRISSLSLPSRFGPIDASALPIPTSALSFLKQVSHQMRGHESYFCGEFRRDGWLTYFPVAFGLKTPVGLLVLLTLAAARVRPRTAWEVACLVCMALLWTSLLRSRVNIGVRYALPTYPLAIPFVARLFEPRALRDRAWGSITLAATAWLVVASAGSQGRSLSYFNEIGGGPSRGWMYLADSNVDWGQDFDGLADAVRRLEIHEVTTDVSTERRLDVPGVFALPNPSKEYQTHVRTPPGRRLYDAEGGYVPVHTRYVAASVSRLLGLYSQNDMSWLRTRRLVARVGDSLFLFDMDRPAETPFGP